MTLQYRADRTMQQTVSNIEFYAHDSFHSWAAPPLTQKKRAMYRPASMRGKVPYRCEVMESIQC